MERISTIASGTTITGTVDCDGSVDVDGKIHGNLRSGGDVTISENAQVKAPIAGRHVTVHGAVVGDVSGEQSVTVGAGGRVVGNLAAPRIGIRPGGLLRGYVSTEGDTPRQGRAGRASASAAPAARPAPRRAEAEAPAPERKAPAPPRKESRAPAPRASSSSAKASNTTNKRAAKKPRRAPAPVVPALKKGARGAVRKGRAR